MIKSSFPTSLINNLFIYSKVHENYLFIYIMYLISKEINNQRVINIQKVAILIIILLF